MSSLPSSVDEEQSGAIPSFHGELEPVLLAIDGDVDCLVGRFIGFIALQVTSDCVLNFLVRPFLAHNIWAVGGKREDLVWVHSSCV